MGKSYESSKLVLLSHTSASHLRRGLEDRGNSPWNGPNPHLEEVATAALIQRHREALLINISSIFNVYKEPGKYVI